MYTVSKEILYYEHSKNNPPTNKIKPKTWFKVETQMNRGPDLSKIPSNLRDIYNNYRSDSQPTNKGNPSSGCIYIEDTKPGDVLIIHIGKIKTHPIGWTRYKGSTGAMPNYLGFSNLGEQFRVCEITENKIIWDNHTNFPVEPMIGVLGVAPEYESRTNAWGGVWGGNMDIQEVTTGAKITLPIFHTGALLHVGDMHARQGDGEICGGGGIETGGSVELFVETKKKPKMMTWPRIENSSHIMTIACDKPAEDAFRTALSEMIFWLESDYKMSKSDAFLFLAQCLEARVTQFVNPTYTYILKVNKKYLPNI